jgi:general secretion pathway protein D
MGAILVITDQPAYLQRAQEWIGQLDHGDETSQRRLYVRYVQNGRAVELAQVLRQAMGVAGARSSEPSSPVAPGLVRSTVSSLAGEGGGGRTMAGNVMQPGNTGTGGSFGGSQPQSQLQGQTASAGSQYNGGQYNAGPGQAGRTGDSGDGGDAVDATQQNQLRIVADARNNALVIYATPVEYELIDQALQRLDIVPLQVLIEATIAEVTLNNGLKYGLQWFFSAGDSSFTLSQLPTGVVAPVFPGFNYVLSAANARIVLNALTTITQVKVISSPQLLVLDNGSARLQVGDQVPVVTQSAVSVQNPGAPIVNSVDYRDTGVILDIVPRVSANGLVILDINQEVSDVVKTESSTIDSPTIQQRRIASSVAVYSGETIALGGLIKDRSENTVNGIPVLSNIPILGNLFKSTSDTHNRTELLVLLSPKVIKSTSDARMATNELRQRLKALTVLQEKMQ